MERDICTCTKERGEHGPKAIVTGACLSFTLDRKATWHAEKDRAYWAKLHKRRQRIDDAVAKVRARLGLGAKP